MDYCLPTEQVKGRRTEHDQEVKTSVSMAVLVMTETLCRSIWSYAVRSKCASERWVAELIVEDLETIGAGQESSIMDVQQAVA